MWKSRKKSLSASPSGMQEKGLGPVNGPGFFNWIVREPFSGAWQRNIEWKRDTVLANHAIFACTTLIASDISKMRIKMVRSDSDGIWVDVPVTQSYRVIEKPNSWQNRIQFLENWMISKLTRGNSYILKQRSSDGKEVIALYVLSPDLVQVLVADDGSVFYQLSPDRLADLETSVIVPASEIIHDRFNCLFHPLCGLSPIFAAGLTAHQGLKIQQNSAWFFENMSQPGGILSAPGAISQETADRVKAGWEEKFSGKNSGKVAVLGDDLKYTPLAATAEQSQMVEQLRLTAEIVCSTYHVPKYKVIGDAPSYNNIEAMEQQYYSQCLQILIESIELCLDEGLEVGDGKGFEFDLSGLLRMDTQSQVTALKEAVGGSLMAPNEARKVLNLKPTPGGEAVLSQQQNYSLEALSKRDSKEDPFSGKSESVQVSQPEENQPSEAAKFMELSHYIRRGLKEDHHA